MSDEVEKAKAAAGGEKVERTLFEKIIAREVSTGALLVRVWRVQLHSSILGNGCMHPSIFRPDAWCICFQVFLSHFPANGQILHPTI